MLKGLGIVMIIAVCTGIGICMSSGLRERQKKLNAICIFIEEVSDRIRTGQELSRIIEGCGASAGVYIDGYGTKINCDGLNAEDISLLEEFLSDLGMGDTDSQIKRCEIYKELIKKQEAAADEQVKAKSGLYGKLGLFSGLFISVLLI